MCIRSFRPSFPLVATAALATAALGVTGSQPSSDAPLAPPRNGPRSAEPARFALTNATVHTSPGAHLENATILIDAGRIVGVGADLDAAIAAGAYRVHDLAGQHVYAGFIDAWVPVEMAPEEDEPGLHWNPVVQPQRDVLDADALPEGTRSKHRGMGFTAAAIAPEDGVFKGRGAVISLAEPFPDASQGETPVYLADAFHAMSFDRVSWPNRGYPSSQMGATAIVRQTLSDATWLSGQPEDHPERGHSAISVLNTPEMPFVLDSRDEREALLARRVFDEVNRPAPIIVGSGTEFRRLAALAEDGTSLIIPLNFPKAPNVSTPGHADATSVTSMMLWEQAPTNPWRLYQAGLRVSLTASKLGRGQSFTTNLQHAVDAGLHPEQALAMLTTNPAEMLGVSSMMGTIEEGKLANLVVTTEPLFHDDSEMTAVWIDGRRHRLADEPREAEPFDGTWRFVVGDPDQPEFEMSYTVDGATISLVDGDDHAAAHRVSIRSAPDGDHISFVVHSTDDDTEGSGIYLVSGTLDPDGVIRGTAVEPSQNSFAWTGYRVEDDEEASDDDADSDHPLAGEWALTLSGEHHLGLIVTQNDDGVAVTVYDESMTDANGDRAEADGFDITATDTSIEFTFDHDPFGSAGNFTIRLSGDADAVHGQGRMPRGQGFNVFGVRPEHAVPNLPGYPFGGYALSERPEQANLAIINATVWTQGAEGTIDNGYVFVQDGVITAVGPMPSLADLDIPAGATVIDAEGRHIAPGIIDAHSHTGLFGAGVNESGQAVTAEVRIGDSTNPDAISWYRQLASGVTSVLQLHGSANPIGGQSQTLKIRWGALHPFDMHFEGAIPGIKFALGENVKQSNWGSQFNSRYPQTRMGVETIIRDRFAAARSYIDNGMALPNGRRDLELHALAEILQNERLIHCHSYRQDEILMLCRVAEEFGFTIGTFTHGLEVYKVAETVQHHAIGASLFADWWAYKVEVQDAIPFAGPLQTMVGVNTSYNSDSDEIVRRLNTEAGKAFHYARRMNLEGFTEEDALAFVTSNPARQLMIDDHVGSIEVGKHADLAIWSRSPLSTLSRCEMTMVDGRVLFSLEQDQAHRARIASERERLIGRILDLPEPERDHTDDADESEGDDDGMRARGLARRGVINPAFLGMTNDEIEQYVSQPGVCGCDWLWSAP